MIAQKDETISPLLFLLISFFVWSCKGNEATNFSSEMIVGNWQTDAYEQIYNSNKIVTIWKRSPVNDYYPFGFYSNLRWQFNRDGTYLSTMNEDQKDLPFAIYVHNEGTWTLTKNKQIQLNYYTGEIRYYQIEKVESNKLIIFNSDPSNDYLNRYTLSRN